MFDVSLRFAKDTGSATARIAERAGLIAALFVFIFCLPPFKAQAQGPRVGPGNVFVHTKFGGFILGYDIDQSGTEGILSESLTLGGGKYDVAVETFDQKTGKILSVVAQQKNSHNDYVTLGIEGQGVGLVEYERAKGIFVGQRQYAMLNPLSGNKFTGRWTPPLTKDDIIIGLSASQGSSNAAVMAFDNGGNFNSFLFSTNVGANTFGSIVNVTDSVFDFNNSPVMAMDTATNQAVLGSSFGCYGCSTEIGLVDLTQGTVTTFPGLGFGFVNGIAVDSNTGIACTTTEDDFSVEFYDLANQTGFIVPIPGATNQAQSGADVEVDPINKLFFVGQPFTSTGFTGSSIQVFDEQGNFVESINGLKLPVSPVRIALNPTHRMGYVLVTPDLTSLQSFTY